MTQARFVRVLTGVLLALVLPATALAQRYHPGLHFETIATAHFRIHFHQGERELAARLAGLAEEVRSELLVGRALPEPGVTHVILSGQDDSPNGWATPVPFNKIEIRTIWPRPSSDIANSADWLRLVFTHEYSHILHLDRSGGLFSLARRIFGRAPFVMPNQFLPIWQVEGIATWREGVTSGRGRVHDGTARRTLDAAAAAGRFEPIDRANGGLVSWPAGDAAYFYGGLFYEYLSQRFGPDALERLTVETARWPPFFGPFAFRRVFGASADALWREFRASWPVRAELNASNAARQVTHSGFETSAPRWASDANDVLFYARRTPHEFPSLRRLQIQGDDQQIAEQFRGQSVSVRGSTILFDQLDLDANTALVSDLYLLDTDQAGGPRRLTHGARAGDADLSPDARSLVFVRSAADRRALMTMSLAGDGDDEGASTLFSEAGVYFSHPRWSPDGSTIVAERQQANTPAQVVLIDVRTRSVRPVAPGLGDRQATPTWMPDGTVVLFAAASGEAPFNLVAASVSSAGAWHVTNEPHGAQAPDVSPDGRRLAFLGYTAAGEEVFVAPLDRSTWQPIAADINTPLPASAPASATSQGPGPSVHPYSPWHGFVPRFWAPVIETRGEGVAMGAATAASDALGRHAYYAAASTASDTRGTDVDVSYSYRRWRPLVVAAFSREVRDVESGRIRSHTLSAGVVVPFLTVRRQQQFVALIRAEQVRLASNARRPLTFARNAVRLGWTLATDNAFPYSISSEEGWVVSVASEQVSRALGADGDANALLAEGRFYQRVFGAHSVVAARASGALSTGDRDVRQLFAVAHTGPVAGPLSFDSDAVALFRGPSTGPTFGSRTAAVNLDLRLPLWRLERGVSTLPFMLRWLHAAAFADTADAWEAAEGPRPRVALGAELSADVVVGYYLPLTVSGGVSWRVDRARGNNEPYFFARIGRSF